jgi:cellobiose phosphorylase
VENAHEFRLTTWHNDPLSDSTGEALYLRDEESGRFWSATPLPARGKSGYVCRHGFGYSVFEHYEAGISSEMFTYVAIDASVKLMVVKLRNNTKHLRRLSLTGYWELVLGEWRHANLMHIVTETDPLSGSLFARNAYGRECAGRIVFVQVSERERTLTGNRTEFIGRNGSLINPAAMRREHLSDRTGAGLDPCAAIQTHVELAEAQEREIVFIFGAARDTAEAQEFIQRFSGPSGARQALEAVWEYWNHILGAVHVETPDTALDVLVNGWLIYQTLSCRLWGRSGYYQSGGAYGFRDQLQDTMALMHASPSLAREHLIRCAERQFLPGDVQHWWHPPNGQGVRTHFSDDYLWLPYATCRYVLVTGDTGVLDELVPFLEGRKVNPEEEAYYDQPQRSARGRKDEAFAEVCSGQASLLRKNIEAHAWDGGWYLRAYFDNGAPLGSSENDECQIDAISQSWAVISGGADKDRARQAMAAVYTHLVRRDSQIIQLFTPPFDKSDLEPGYIKGYVPGVRENGGQYTHAAIWNATAYAMLGDKKRAWELFTMLNPINHSLHRDEAERYKVEPYVMCADIYAAPPHTGRGGWTWYTGAAGLMYRLSVETLLGVHLKVDQLSITPCIPSQWESFKIHYRYRETVYHITVRRVSEQSEQVSGVMLDGVWLPATGVDSSAQTQSLIPLVDDHQEHYVEVNISQI